MRTKRSAKGRFHRSSRMSESATYARPLPPPITDNISNGNDGSEDRMEFHNYVESDDIASDFCGDDMRADFDEKTCLQCDRGEQLLFCCGIGCRIALHEKCVLGQPKYDGGKFYCPYCWYKLQRTRTEELRKKVMAAKEDVNSFINYRHQVACTDNEKDNDKRVKEKNLNVGKNMDENNHCEHVNNKCVNDVQKVAQEVEEVHQHNDTSNADLPCIDRNVKVAECEKLSVNQTHGIVVDEGTDKGMDEQQNDAEIVEKIHADEECAGGRVAENTVVDCAFHGFLISNTSKRDKVRMKKKKEQMNKDVPAANVSCTADHGALDSPEVPDSKTDNHVARLRHVKRRNIQKEDWTKSSAVHAHIGSTRDTRKPVQEVAPLKKPKQTEMPAEKFIDLPLAHEKHKRMLWKPEEEEMFKNGVWLLEGDCQHNSKVKCPCSDRSVEVAECEKISATHARRIAEDEVGMEQGKNDQPDDDEKGEEINMDEEHVETLTAQSLAENIAVDGAFHGYPGGKSETANKCKGDRPIMEKEEQMNKVTSTATVSCAIEDGTLNCPAVPDSETERLVKQRNRQKADSLKKSKAPSHTTSTKATQKLVEEIAPFKKALLPEIPAKTYPPVTHEMRKRIFWKPEEEETLREGVHKFSTTVNKNLPWRKILEFGRHVFDPCRSPADLKDKWRKILAKQS